MATKTISNTEEAYTILKSKKTVTESFSEAIIKLSGKKNLSSFYGALSEESANALEESIKDARKSHLSSHKKRLLQQ